MTEGVTNGWHSVLDRMSDPAKRDALVTALAMLQAPYTGGEDRRKISALEALLKKEREANAELRWRLSEAELRVESARQAEWTAERFRLNSEIDRLRAELRALYAEKK